MIKFGGSGRMKQTCIERKCPNLGVEMDDGTETEDEIEVKAGKVKSVSSDLKSKKKRSGKSAVEWIGDPLVEATDSDPRIFYGSVCIGGEEFVVGDCVLVPSDEANRCPYVGKMMSMWQEKSKFGNADKMVHIDWYVRASETVLQEAGHSGELFLVDECEDLKASCIEGKVEVHHIPPHRDWAFMGGVEEDRKLPKCDGSTSFYYQKWYDPICARFQDPPCDVVSDEPDYCPSCVRINQAKAKETPTARREVRQEEGVTYYAIASLNGENYEVGDCVYLPPSAFSFSTKASAPKKKFTSRSLSDVDEDEYPELYRKGGHIKGSNEEVAEPFRIARILAIYSRREGKHSSIKLRVSKFYRPENTHKPLKSTYYNDLNLLYWSEEEAVVDFSLVEGKCRVECEYDLSESPTEFYRKAPDRFYFSEAYLSKNKEFIEPPMRSRRAGLRDLVQKYNQSRSKMTKLVKLTKADVKKAEEQEQAKEEKPLTKLRSLDVFSGCGGLSEGFHQAEIAESSFAIELWEPAAQAFRLNNPGAIVLTEDCNVLLEMVMNGKEKSNCGQRLPQKGDIDLLCGGPPCQGFSGMNRFNSREYSRFKNSLVVSYLSYCDYYRPRFFVLENVRNFVSFKNCMVLKLSLAALVKMGYQCTFGVLQAGHYGVAQTRRRAIILAAAPGEQLPLFPEPLHTFSARSGSLIAQVGDRKYMSNITRMSSAPLRTITVRDTMSDLPSIKNGHSKLEMAYQSEPQSHFQRLIRRNQRTMLQDHICKDMSALVEARMSRIPLAPGSDWRDLPNHIVKLSDGTSTKLLRYEHHDRKQGKSSTSSLRGVCSCASGKSCDPTDRQFNTLIPWCLPHTSNRHNHWAGLYGRLDWSGFFSTTVTNPEPMGKQGRVLHPEQHRVVSVRECARSQGFPDCYRFFGTILDKHREVGNAVPPPLAKAIGWEIKKCLQWKAAQVSDMIKDM